MARSASPHSSRMPASAQTAPMKRSASRSPLAGHPRFVQSGQESPPVQRDCRLEASCPDAGRLSPLGFSHQRLELLDIGRCRLRVQSHGVAVGKKHRPGGHAHRFHLVSEERQRLAQALAPVRWDRPRPEHVDQAFAAMHLVTVVSEIGEESSGFLAAKASDRALTVDDAQTTKQLDPAACSHGGRLHGRWSQERRGAAVRVGPSPFPK